MTLEVDASPHNGQVLGAQIFRGCVQYFCHNEEGGLYAANVGIKHTEEYDLYSESGHVNKQWSKHPLCFNKENMIDIYYYK